VLGDEKIQFSNPQEPKFNNFDEATTSMTGEHQAFRFICWLLQGRIIVQYHSILGWVITKAAFQSAYYQR
jgi:hypothetical protein